MASAKLTTTVRATIVLRILRHRFGGEVAQLVADNAAFAERCYEDVYDRTKRSLMDSLPKGWLPRDANLLFQFGASMHRCYFNGELSGVLGSLRDGRNEPVQRMIAYKHRHGAARVYDATEQRVTEFTELENRRTTLLATVTEAKRQVEAVVNAATTTGKLKELWPESAAFLEGFEDTKLSLPAIPVKDLNAMLDLPVEE